jgi:hypothetical protein
MSGPDFEPCRLEPAELEAETSCLLYVCRRLNLGRIRKDIDNPGATWETPAEHSQLVCRTKNLQDQSLSSSSEESHTLPPEVE